MKQWWNRFLWKFEDAFFIALVWVVSVTLIVGGATAGIMYGMAKQDQYNCNLKERPSLYVTFWINHDTYGYNPEGFCKQLKEKMAK